MKKYSLLSGLAGATALTVVHQGARYLSSKAPRMDVLGQRALKPLIARTGWKPSGMQMQALALAGDMVANSLYYAAVGGDKSKHRWQRGLLLGAAAGAGALTLPQVMGLGRRPQGRTLETKVMAFSWYVIGGLAAAGISKALASRRAT